MGQANIRPALPALILFLSASAATGAQSTTLVAYTAHENAVLSQMVPEFEKDTGEKLEIVRLSSGAAVERLAAESADPRCDVIWSISGERLQANASLLQAYRPRDWGSINPLFKVGTNWLPYTCLVDVIIANTRLLSSAQRPGSWADLAEAKWKGRICSGMPTSSGSAYTQMVNVLLAFPADGWDMYGKIVSNFFTASSSDSVSKYVADGEAPLGITIEDNAYRFEQGGGPVQIIYPREGIVAIPDGIAIVKGAPHLEAAKTFIDWCLSKKTQRLLVERMYRRSVRMDCPGPTGLPRLDSLKVLPYDFEAAASNMGAYQDKFRGLGSPRR